MAVVIELAILIKRRPSLANISWDKEVEILVLFALLGAYLGLVLWRIWRRLIGLGIVGSHAGWRKKEFIEQMRDCTSEYLFVGNSFKPHLEAFLESYHKGLRGPPKLQLVVAPAEQTKDAELAREHAEVISALRNIGVDVMFRTMKRPASWCIHVFDASDENNAVLVIGLNPPDGSQQLPRIVKIQRVPRRPALFEHFLQEGKTLWSDANVKNTDLWLKDLRRLG